MRQTHDPSALVLTFGKHKGTTVGELIEREPDYARWLAAQGWVAEKFAELHAAILSRAATTDDTPEHNALQARFIDHDFRVAFLQAAYKHWLIARIKEIQRFMKQEKGAKWNNMNAEDLFLITSVAFEQKGVDVVIKWDWVSDKNDRYLAEEAQVEIKPSVGDDFPSVMRQMERLRVSNCLAETYNGRAVPEETVKAMFKANGMRLLFLRDVEAELLNTPSSQAFLDT